MEMSCRMGAASQIGIVPPCVVAIAYLRDAAFAAKRVATRVDFVVRCTQPTDASLFD